MKVFHKPIRITVTQDSDGDPVAFSSKRGTERVGLVRGGWMISQDWRGRKEIHKEFFLIETVRGTACEICRSVLAQAWYLSGFATKKDPVTTENYSLLEFARQKY